MSVIKVILPGVRNRTFISALILLIVTLYFSPLTSGAEKVEAVLSGHAIIPAMSVLSLPDDAPEHLQVTGKYTHPDAKRRDEAGSSSEG